MKININKMDICMIKVCERCFDYAKFNRIIVDEKEDKVKIEYICDCGNIQIDDVEVKYV